MSRLIAFFSLVGIFVLIFISPSLYAQNAPAPSVVVQTVKMKDVTPSFQFVGRIEAQHKVDIRARVNGFLTNRAFEEGAKVTAGQLLFEIEPDIYQLQVKQNEAELASAKANLSQATAAFKRLKNLSHKGAVSQSDFDKAQAEQLVAEANVLTAKVELKKSELNLGFTKIYSPITGRIARENYSVGNYLNSDAEVLTTVTSTDPVNVTLSISEKSMLGARRKGIDLKNPPVAPTMKLSDGSLYDQAGHFDYFDTEVNTSTDTILIRAQFPNPKGVLLPGELVQVIITDKQKVMGIVIKQSAVQKDSQGYFVLGVDKENKVNVKRITVGKQIDGQWQVLSGLTVGEQVIIEGLQKVGSGGIVNPVEG
ncbi:efflux RND transporter periplasmic adaptor subunit [Algibacillus agarilyticus]|uniref:efflux RND transporter periplasmic adaptor subunit n=1 Tax=Algibacillus agarilyticus TaxID=2234133 RepID=UPI000DCF70AB|nr:efflux RND transporter periplasmic adaptor subunit [Algibacillus agarilyticus]